MEDSGERRRSTAPGEHLSRARVRVRVRVRLRVRLRVRFRASNHGIEIRIGNVRVSLDLWLCLAN